MSTSDLEQRYGITPDQLREMHDEWKAGASKSELERAYLGKPQAHGKLFTNLMKRYLGIDAGAAEKRHPLSVENEKLRALLKQNGIEIPADLMLREFDEAK